MIVKHTVDGNGNRFCQLVAILADERWDFAEMVDAQVVIRNTLAWIGFHNLKVHVIGLSYCANGSGTRVALRAVSAKANWNEPLLLTS